MRRFTLALLVPLFACCTIQEPFSAPEAPTPDPQEVFVPGTAFLLLSEEAADSFDAGAFFAETKSLGFPTAERVFPPAGEFEQRHRAAGLHRWYRVSYDPSVSRTKAGADLESLPGVEAVSFPRRKASRGYFNDRFYDDYQWNFRNSGGKSHFKSGIDINVEDVWKFYTGGSKDVIVAVLDSGVDPNHEDLGGVVLTASEGSRNFLSGNHSYLQAGDHGTHVGGIIAAVNDNGTGVCGIAGGVNGQGGARLMSCVILPDDEDDEEEGSGSEDAEALVWAADHGAVIANNSWGYVADSAEDARQMAEDFEKHSSPTKTAINYFIDHAGTDANGNQTGPMKGGVVLFASGNDGFNHDAPSEYSRVLAVGAFGPDGKMPLFSNYGSWVDILAPGGSDSEEEAEEWILSCVPDDGSGYAPYAFMAGTSMACPHAAGVAALLVSYFGGPGFTNEQLTEALLGGAKQGVLDLQGRKVGGGKLDAMGAFEYLGGTPPSPEPVNITFSNDYDGDGKILSHVTVEFIVRIDGNDKARLPVSFSSDCPSAEAVCSNSRVQVRIDALQSKPGDYTASVLVGSVARYDFPFTILPNHAPQLVRELDDQIVNAASAASFSIDLAEHFTDPDGETPVYSGTVSDGNIVSGTLSGSLLTLTPKGYGLAEIRITAKDARGDACTASFRMLARNTYQDIDVYPNPVTDYLNVRPATDVGGTVALYNRAGAKVFSANANAGPFTPYSIDVRHLAPGTYTLQVDFGGKQYTQNIVKY